MECDQCPVCYEELDATNVASLAQSCAHTFWYVGCRPAPYTRNGKAVSKLGNFCYGLEGQVKSLVTGLLYARRDFCTNRCNTLRRCSLPCILRWSRVRQLCPMCQAEFTHGT